MAIYIRLLKSRSKARAKIIAMPIAKYRSKRLRLPLTPAYADKAVVIEKVIATTNMTAHFLSSVGFELSELVMSAPSQ